MRGVPMTIGCYLVLREGVPGAMGRMPDAKGRMPGAKGRHCLIWISFNCLAVLFQTSGYHLTLWRLSITVVRAAVIKVCRL